MPSRSILPERQRPPEEGPASRIAARVLPAARREEDAASSAMLGPLATGGDSRASEAVAPPRIGLRILASPRTCARRCDGFFVALVTQLGDGWHGERLPAVIALDDMPSPAVRAGFWRAAREDPIVGARRAARRALGLQEQEVADARTARSRR